jgi:hypothetical protein
VPAKSDRQRRYLYSRFGKEWVHRHHFDRTENAGARKGGRALRAAAKRRSGR